jgi:FMN phosphatase YigB (HAD superfamily)
MFADSISHYQTNTSKKLNPKAIFFDMVGVLFDSMPYHATAWVKAMTDTEFRLQNMKRT